MEVAGSSLTFSQAPLDEALHGLTRLGFVTVELAAIEGWAHIAPSRLVADFAGELAGVRRALAAAGLRAVAINAGLGTEDAAAQGCRAGALFQLAVALRIPVVTLPAGSAQAGPAAAQAHLRPLLAEAVRHGVTLAVETHMGAVTEQPAAAVALCRALPGLRLTLDPSHYWAGPAQGRGWEATLPLVAHVHLRDAGFGGWPEIQVWPGRGAVDFPAVRAALSRAGYLGGQAIEYIDSLPVQDGPDGRGAAEAAAEMARQSASWAS